MDALASLREMIAQTDAQLRANVAGLGLLLDAVLDAPEPGNTEAAQRLRALLRRSSSLRYILKDKRLRIAEMLDSPLVDVRAIGVRVMESDEKQEFTPQLLRGLSETDEEVRRACMYALRHRVHPKALLPSLRSEKPQEREAALEVLDHSRLDELGDVQAALRQLLTDPVPSVRHLVARLLREDLEAPGLYKALLDTVQVSPVLELRLRAIQSLSQHPVGEDAIAVLLGALRRDEEFHRQPFYRGQDDMAVAIQKSAAEALGRVAPLHPQVVDALLNALRDPSPEVSRQAAWSLVERGPATDPATPRLLAALEDETLPEVARGGVAAVLAHLNERAVIPMLLRLLTRPSETFQDHHDWDRDPRSCHGGWSPREPQLKIAAARALGLLEPPPAEAVPVLLACIKDANRLSLEAAQGVLRTGLAGAELEKLLRELLSKASGVFGHELRDSVLRLLANFTERNAELRVMVRGWISKEGEIYPEARRQLGVLVRSQPDFVERIETLAKDPNHEVAYAAREALRVLGNPHTDVVMRLVSRLTSADAGARHRAVEDLRLYQHRGTWLADPLGGMLRRASPEGRIAILNVLGVANGGSPGSSPFGIFEPVFKDADPRVREAAAWALCDLTRAHRDALPWLVKLLGDADARVREAAAWALSLHPQGRETEAPLRAALADEEPAVRGAVAAALDALELAHPGETRREAAGTPEQVLRSVREFAMIFYEALCRDSLGNQGFSPLAVFTLMAMVLRGTRGPTEADLQQVLSWPAAPWRLPGLLEQLTGQLQDLGTALGCWWLAGSEPRAEYIAELTEKFGVTPAAGMQSNAIDAWAREHTKDSRASIRIGAKKADAHYTMASAAHLHLRWERPVYRETREARFHLPNGSEVEVPTMTLGGRFGYAHKGWYQLIEMPLPGGNTAMVVLLPDAGFLSRAERLLQGSKVGVLLEGASQRDFMVTLPRFSVLTSLNLSWNANALKLEALFEPDADLSGMAPGPEPFPVSLNHVASVTVAEPAEEAEAVRTSPPVMQGRSPLQLVNPNGEGLPAMVEINRPFLFLFRHEATRAPLFLGRLVDPRPPEETKRKATAGTR